MTVQTQSTSRIPIDRILANPEQPRKFFDQLEMDSLAESIRENDVIQPLVVEWADAGTYILHDGERRLRAAKMAGLKDVPVVIVPPLNGSGPQERMFRALVANIQRADLSPIEEAKAYGRLRDDLGISSNQIAIRLGISNARVSDRLRLLELEPEIQDLIGTGKLTKDIRLVTALEDISSSEARVKLATKLAERHATIKASLEACKNLKYQLQSKNITSGIPSIRVATKKAGESSRTRWDVFAGVGKLPPWPFVEICARDTCDACDIRPMATEAMCGACPLVECLIKMIGKTGLRIL
jgi:ParB/RepB/Spo0J family partition protein